MSQQPVIIEGLEYRFGRRKALADIDLRIGTGEILGLVGPNGSGKTTLLKILAGLLRPSAGEVRVFGLDPFRDRARVMRRARFAFAPPPLFEGLTAHEHIAHLAGLGGQRPGRAAVTEALEVVGLADRAGDRVRTFSLGMRQRLTLAQALLPRPELLVLDEPTDGLDPLAVLELRGVLERLRDDHGVTILLASHLMVEVEELVDRILVLMDGRVEFCGAPQELMRKGERLRLAPATGNLEDFAAHLRAAGHGDARVDGESVLVAAGALDLESARELARAGDFGLAAFAIERPHLQAALLERQRQRLEVRRS